MPLGHAGLWWPRPGPGDDARKKAAGFPGVWRAERVSDPGRGKSPVSARRRAPQLADGHPPNQRRGTTDHTASAPPPRQDGGWTNYVGVFLGRTDQGRCGTSQRRSTPDLRPILHIWRSPAASHEDRCEGAVQSRRRGRVRPPQRRKVPQHLRPDEGRSAFAGDIQAHTQRSWVRDSSRARISGGHRH